MCQGWGTSTGEMAERGLRHLIFWQHAPQSTPLPPLQRSHQHGAAGKVSFQSSSPAPTLPRRFISTASTLLNRNTSQATPLPPSLHPAHISEHSLFNSEIQRARDTFDLSLVSPSHLSPLLPFQDRNAPDTFLTCSCHWHLEEAFQLHFGGCQSRTGSASYDQALQADFCAQAASKRLLLNFKVINRQTPESTELLPHIVWENTTQNGSMRVKIALVPNFQRGSQQPIDPSPSVHAADSLLGKIIGHFLLQLNCLFRETTENPTHPILLKNLDLTRSSRQAYSSLACIPTLGKHCQELTPTSHTASNIPECHSVFLVVLLDFGEAACIQKMPPNTAGASTALPERDYNTVS